MGRVAERAEWLRLMQEIAAADRDRYRQLRAEIWQEIAATHARRTDDERAGWQARSN